MAWLPWFWPAMLVWIALSSLAFALALRELIACYPDERAHGRVLGGFHTLTDLGTIVGPLAFLPLYGALGANVFVVMALTALPLWAAYMWLGAAPVKSTLRG